MRLSDATVLVTGANRGIGRALAAELAKHSERVYAGVRNPAAFEPIEGDLRAEVLPLAIDLSSRASIDASFAQSREQLAGVEVLVNNAGLLSVGLLEEQDADAYYAMMQVNLVGLIHLTQLMLPAMLQRGSGQIVNNASISGYAYFPLASTYAASKAGVVAFSESLRRELRGTGVGVTHLITPGVKTDMLGETRDAYGSHIDTSGWDEIPAEEWAARVVAGIERDEAAVMPSGKPALTVKLAGGPRVLLDRVAARIFTR